MKKIFTSLFILLITLASSGFSILPAQAQGTWTAIINPAPSSGELLSGVTHLTSLGNTLIAFAGSFWFRSTDGGKTWQKFTPSGFSIPTINNFVNFKGTLYAGASIGLYGVPGGFLRSTDGVSWSSVTLPVPVLAIETLYASPTTLFAQVITSKQMVSGIPQYSYALVSTTDGITWTILNTQSPTHYFFTPPAYLNGAFFGFGYENKTQTYSHFRSSDGVTWIPITISGFTPSTPINMARIDGAFATDLGPIAYNDVLYVFRTTVLNATKPFQVFRSTDGANYSSVPTSGLIGDIVAMTPYQGRIYVVATTNLASALQTVYEYDSINWTTTSSSNLLLSNITHLASLGNTLVAFAGSSWFRSTDGGKAWQKFTPSGLTAQSSYVNFVNFKNTLYVGFNMGAYAAPGGLFRSTDGNNWSAPTLPVTVFAIDVLYASPTTLFVQVVTSKQMVSGIPQYSYALVSTTDGITWTVLNTKSPTHAFFLSSPPAYLNGAFFGFGYENKTQTYSHFRSSDGVTWTPITISGFTPSTPISPVRVGTVIYDIDIGPIAYNNALFVFRKPAFDIKQPLQVFRSTDGSNYVSISTDGLVGQVDAVTHHQDKIYVVATTISTAVVAGAGVITTKFQALYSYFEPLTTPPPSNLTNITFSPKLQGRTDLTGVSFTIQVFAAGQTTELAKFTVTGGTGSLPSTVTLIPGTYDIRSASSYYLSQKATMSLASSQTFTLPTLPAGDLNQDQTINSLDWSLMSPKWFTSDPVADLNKDGSVNSIDFSLLNRNWGKSGG